MIKRIVLCVLCMIITAFSVFVSAENAQKDQGADVAAEQSMPQDARVQGGRSGMGGMRHPSGERPQMPSGTERPKMPSNGEMPQRPDGEVPAEFNGDMPNFSRGEVVQQPNVGATTQGDTAQKENGETKVSESGETASDKSFEMPQNGRNGMGGMDGFGGMMPGQNGSVAESTPMTFMGFLKEYQTPIIAVILLALAFVFVVFYKKKNY